MSPDRAPEGQTRVVVVDDSPVVCRILTKHLSSAPDLLVVGTALTGARALALVDELRPDLVTLDLELPDANGLEVLDEIMRRAPTPVVVVSGASPRDAWVTSKALELGAVDFVLKYVPGVDPE